MILVERSAHVTAPVEAVWEVVQRAEQLPAWLAGVRATEALSGAASPPTRPGRARLRAEAERVICCQERT